MRTIFISSVFIITILSSFMSTVIYYITYPKYDRNISIKIKLPNNSDCKIKNAIANFTINVEEEVHNARLRKL